MINIDELIKNARLQKSDSLIYYQNLKNEFMKFEKEKGNVLTEENQIKILSKYCSKLLENAAQFLDSGREDLTAKYAKEEYVLRQLLPEPVSEQSIEQVITEYASSQNWFNEEGKLIIPKQFMGQIIKDTKSAFPAANGKIISEIVKKYVQ